MRAWNCDEQVHLDKRNRKLYNIVTILPYTFQLVLLDTVSPKELYYTWYWSIIPKDKLFFTAMDLQHVELYTCKCDPFHIFQVTHTKSLVPHTSAVTLLCSKGHQNAHTT